MTLEVQVCGLARRGSDHPLVGRCFSTLSYTPDTSEGSDANSGGKLEGSDIDFTLAAALKDFTSKQSKASEVAKSELATKLLSDLEDTLGSQVVFSGKSEEEEESDKDDAPDITQICGTFDALDDASYQAKKSTMVVESSSKESCSKDNLAEFTQAKAEYDSKDSRTTDEKPTNPSWKQFSWDLDYGMMMKVPGCETSPLDGMPMKESSEESPEIKAFQTCVSKSESATTANSLSFTLKQSVEIPYKASEVDQNTTMITKTLLIGKDGAACEISFVDEDISVVENCTYGYLNQTTTKYEILEDLEEEDLNFKEKDEVMVGIYKYKKARFERSYDTTGKAVYEMTAGSVEVTYNNWSGTLEAEDGELTISLTNSEDDSDTLNKDLR